jgi:excinuclease ABC subunit B
MYADHVTGSMKRAMDETTRRRKIQEDYNKSHNQKPVGITRTIEKGMRPELTEEAKSVKLNLNKIPKDEYKHIIKDLTAQMDIAALNLQFETAAELRDMISDVNKRIDSGK